METLYKIGVPTLLIFFVACMENIVEMEKKLASSLVDPATRPLAQRSTNEEASFFKFISTMKNLKRIPRKIYKTD